MGLHVKRAEKENNKIPVYALSLTVRLRGIENESIEG